MLYLKLFWEFFKTGLFAIGGGMATVPFLQKMAEETGWFTQQDLINMIAVSESTPGPIGINMATYVGFSMGIEADGATGALAGAVIATMGIVTPSLIIILAAAVFLKKLHDNQYLNGLLYGLRPASTGLIAAAGIGVAADNLFAGDMAVRNFGLDMVNWKGWALVVVLWVLTNKVKWG